MPDRSEHAEERVISLTIQVSRRTEIRLRLMAAMAGATVGQLVQYLVATDNTLPAIPPHAIDLLLGEGTRR